MLLDLSGYIQPGDTVAWPQGSGEPLELTRELGLQHERLRDVTLFFGTLLSDTVTPAWADHYRLTSFGGLVNASRLTKRGLVDVRPIRVSQVPRLIETREIPVDVALISVAGPDEQGHYSMGLVPDYVRQLVRSARVVIAEVNAQAPFTYGDALTAADLDVVVPVDYTPAQTPGQGAAPTAENIAVAERIAALVPDGATLQIGFGGVIDALGVALREKNDLGLHTGLVGDVARDLIERGVVTNKAKEIDPGVSVTGAVFGSADLYRWADRNPLLAMRGLDYTHHAGVLSRLDSLWAINAAIEVDLSGQLNSEVAAGSYIGAVGGQLEFATAACASRHGRSVIALPATAARGTVSRIVPRLADGVVSTARADVDLIVTEYGVADLRAASLAERRERLIAIAHPDFRDQLREESA